MHFHESSFCVSTIMIWRNLAQHHCHCGKQKETVITILLYLCRICLIVTLDIRIAATQQHMEFSKQWTKDRPSTHIHKKNSLQGTNSQPRKQWSNTVEIEQNKSNIIQHQHPFNDKLCKASCTKCTCPFLNAPRADTPFCLEYPPKGFSLRPVLV